MGFRFRYTIYCLCIKEYAIIFHLLPKGATAITWTQVVVDAREDVGIYPSVAVNFADRIHISYHDASNKDLKYATNASGGRTSQAIDPNRATISNVIREEDQELPMICMKAHALSL